MGVQRPLRKTLKERFYAERRASVLGPDDLVTLVVDAMFGRVGRTRHAAIHERIAAGWKRFQAENVFAARWC